MLGAIAAVALVVGSIGAAVSLHENDQQAKDQSREPVVEVQAVQSADLSTD